MTRAAEYLRVTQPTISRQVQLLETSIGFRVFDRKSGGRLIPTTEGRLLFEQLEGTLNTLESLPEIAHSILHYETRRLRIAATTPLLNSDILIEAIRRLRLTNPKSTMHLERARRENIEAMVAGGEAEIGLCAMPVTNSALDAHFLVSTVAVAVVARGHPLAERAALGAADVPNGELILPTAASILGQLAWEDDDPASPPPPVRVHLMLTGFRLAAAGLGVLVCDPLTATTFGSDAVRVLPWRPRIGIDYCYVVARDRADSAILTSLIEILKGSAASWHQSFTKEFRA